MQYTPPIDDLKFGLKYLAGFDEVTSLPAFDHLSLDLAETIIEEAGKLAAEQIAPLNHDADMQSAVRLETGEVRTPDGFADAYKAMAEGGWTAMEASEAYGGQQMPMLVSAAVNEIWQSSSLSFALCHLLTQGQIFALEQSASEQQKQIFIPPMVEGRWTGTMNLTEPQAGTDLAAIKTRAVKQGDHYLITGQKIYITYGEHDMAENIVHLVLARTPDAPPGVKGISVFIVPKILVNDDGSLGEANDVKCLSIEKKLGIKASPTAVLQYGENGGAIGYLVGEENQGLEIMFGMMNHARFAVGLQGLAISERAYQQAVDYAQNRIQGTPLEGEKGQSISHHPDVLRLLAVMRAEIEAMRAVALYCGTALDKAHYASAAEEAGSADARASLLVPVVKGWLTERSVALTSDAVQVHGGMGFIEETGAAQHFRDARILPIYEGTTAIQANDLIFRKTLRDQGENSKALFTEITADMQAIDSPIAQDVTQAVHCAEEVLECLLAKANRPRQAAAGGVNWLMLMGYLVGGWQMVRAYEAAEKAGDDFSAPFLSAKKVTAQIYITHCLPHIQRLAAAIVAEDDPVLAMDTGWLAR